MCVDVFKPSHSEMKLFLKHELNWFAVYSKQHLCAQLCNVGWFPIKACFLLLSGLMAIQGSFFVMAVKPP